MGKKPLVSSFSMAFKRATMDAEDVQMAKQEHRDGLKKLIDRYYEEVEINVATGIRNPKELAEIIKLDLLLMGEATEKTSNEITNDSDLLRISNKLNMQDPDVIQLAQSLFDAMNEDNDEQDEIDTHPGIMKEQQESTVEEEVLVGNEEQYNEESEEVCDILGKKVAPLPIDTFDMV